MTPAQEKAARATREAAWNAKAAATFVGRRIVSASYMTEVETRAQGWSRRPLVLGLDDGTFIYSASDDEGNDGGALLGARGEEDKSFPAL